MSLLERFMKEMGGAVVAAGDFIVLGWDDGQARVTPDALEEFLAELLNVPTEKWMRDLGLQQGSGTVWFRGCTYIDSSATRDDIRRTIIRTSALQGDPRWTRVGGCVWRRNDGDTQLVYNAITNRLTTSTTHTPTLEEMCS